MAEQQLVVFGLGKEEFGIDISRVREIVLIQNITSIPQAADFVEGIVNLRGQIVPIVDLCKRFRVANAAVTDESARRIIVVNIAGQNIGILVDGVSEILRIADESMEPTPPLVAGGIGSDFITGVAKVEGRLIIVLDLDRIFSSDEKEVLAQSVE